MLPAHKCTLFTCNMTPRFVHKNEQVPNFKLRIDTLFCKLKITGISKETELTSKEIWNISQLEDAVKLLECKSEVNRIIIKRLLRKSGRTDDLICIFEKALSLKIIDNSACYYMPLLKNAFASGDFERAEDLLILAEYDRVVDPTLFATFILLSSKQNSFEMCKIGFNRLKEYYEYDHNSCKLDFNAQPEGVQQAYQHFIRFLIERNEVACLNDVFLELISNWQLPPLWLTQFKNEAEIHHCNTLEQVCKMIEEAPLQTIEKSDLDTTSNFSKALGYKKENKYKESIPYFKKAAEEGVAEAMYELAMCASEALGIVEDQPLAVKWLKCAAHLKLPLAIYTLGIHYQKGRGIAQDSTKAFLCYSEASAKGCLQASLALAYSHLHGIGTKKNKALAQNIFSQISSFPEAQNSRLYAELYVQLNKHKTEEANNKKRKLNEAPKEARKKARVLTPPPVVLTLTPDVLTPPPDEEIEIDIDLNIPL